MVTHLLNALLPPIVFLRVLSSEHNSSRRRRIFPEEAPFTGHRGHPEHPNAVTIERLEAIHV